jgi:hypothetical protein
VAAIAWATSQRNAAVRARPMAFVIPFGEPPATGPTPRRSVAITDDGSVIAYASRSRLWLRHVDRIDASAVAGTLSATNPFFSPDGVWLGFHGDLPGLMKVRVSGGTPEIIVRSTERPTGATWGRDGTIVFGTTEGLYRVPAAGGPATLLVKPRARQAGARLRVAALPSNGHLLYTIVPTAGSGQPRIALLNPETGESRTVVVNASVPHDLRSGHLVYAADGTLKVASFDSATALLSGEATLANVDVRVWRGSASHN